MGARLGVAALGLALAACGVLEGDRPQLGIANGTDLPLVVTVTGSNFSSETQIDAHASTEIDGSRLPALPWTVEARTRSGRLLVTMVVLPGQVTRTTHPDGSVEMTGTLGRVDLSCGRLDLWAGAPALGPAPGPGVPGDCAP
jgi:hypothetical protein